MKNNNNEMMISGAIIFREGRSKKIFLLTKNTEGEWEILKSIVRKGESSVRASIRYTTEQGSMNIRVLEEASRATGTAKVNGKIVTQRYIYYIMLQKAAGEAIGLGEVDWFDYATATRRLKLKREKDALRATNVFIKAWIKERKKK